jgi:hypothetical protein
MLAVGVIHGALGYPQVHRPGPFRQSGHHVVVAEGCWALRSLVIAVRTTNGASL